MYIDFADRFNEATYPYLKSTEPGSSNKFVNGYVATRRRRQRIGVKYANNGPCKIDDEQREKWREREGAGMRERFKPSATPFPSSETWKEKGAEIKCTYRKISRDRD